MGKEVKQDLLDMMKNIKLNNNFVVIDIETTGFHPAKGARIIEIGAVKLVDGQITNHFDEFVNPEMKISTKITELTGISNEDVKEADTINKVLNRLYEIIDDESVLVFHNKQFDWDLFLTTFFAKAGIVCSNPTVCTLKLSRQLYPQEKSYKLFDLVSKIKTDISKDKTHRADYDAELTSYLLLDLKKQILEKDSSSNEAQMSLLPNSKEKQEVVHNASLNTYEYKIRSINFWSKKFSNKLYERIYVYLNCGIVFYDFHQKEWGAKECQFTLNFKAIERLVLNMLKKNNLDEVFKYYKEENTTSY